MADAAVQPLNGVRVLDLTRVLAGPLCTMLLGDLGADVIKVERTGSGDDTRGWGPPFDDRGESAYFLSVNRNKLSMAADLAVAGDRELLLDLIAGSDVVVDNFRPGVLERRGLEAMAALERHPRLIWCTITGFGQGNGRPGYDFVAQAEQGWMAITGEAGGSPMKVGVALADVVAGKDAAVAVLAALTARGLRGDRPARDRRLTVSLAASAAAALVNVAQNALLTGQEAARWGNAHPNLVPYQYFATADRGLVVAVGSDAQWQACARALGVPELAEEPRFRTNAGRVRHRVELVDSLQRHLATAGAAEWRRRLEEVDVPVGEVRGVLDVVREAGGSPIAGMPPSIPGGAVRLPPPRLDEHGDRVRASGWSVFESPGDRHSPQAASYPEGLQQP